MVIIAANFPLYWLLTNAYMRYLIPAGQVVAIVLMEIRSHTSFPK